ncbi:hypothetical protein F7734_13785 [Scytonema sp. UIC 10036]|uniref:hypothetical protein n=1 Tax=Scytonema sp. UIC 10036 TaxID=2304196 RepID=UPI0012DA3996|nr:hypothetical protein [Scytonema sp. UIC 10036]MUG93443.1 hypothetical protein [Scytonema sp. UIC 10036]
MTLQELQEQALQLPISERWYLVQSVLASIQKETLSSISESSSKKPLNELDPWTQSLIGAVELGRENLAESYVDYLEEKCHRNTKYI